jgi:hypothetical protein
MNWILSLALIACLCVGTAFSLTCDASTSIPALLSTPFTSNMDAETRLKCLQNVYLATNDPKGIFLGTYLVVTVRTNEKIQENYFHDNEWVGHYMVRSPIRSRRPCLSHATRLLTTTAFRPRLPTFIASAFSRR